MITLPLLPLALVGISCAPQLHASQSQEQPGNNDQKVSAPPINITVASPEKTPQEKQDESDRATRQELRDERIVAANQRIAFWTIILAIAAGAQLLSGGLAFYAANRSARAAERAANTANSALVTGQRAFVFIGQIQISRISNYPISGPPIERAHFTVEFFNAGQTPAVEVVGRINIVKSPTRPSDATILGEPIENRIYHIAARGSLGLFHHKGIDEVFERNPWGLARTGVVATPMNEYTYVFGWAAYRDIFGNPHAVEFCRKLWNFGIVRTGTPDDDANPPIRFDFTDEFSEIDHRCPNYAAIIAKLPPRNHD